MTLVLCTQQNVVYQLFIVDAFTITQYHIILTYCKKHNDEIIIVIYS